MNQLRSAFVILVLAVLALAALSVDAQANEEKILILTTSDTRSELVPCG